MGNGFVGIYSVQTVFLVAFAATWYKAAEVEKQPPLIWTGLSIGVYCLTWLWFGWGWPGILFGQIVLLAVVTLVRAWRYDRDDV